jgi:hypothetical protein
MFIVSDEGGKVAEAGVVKKADETNGTRSHKAIDEEIDDLVKL